MDIILVLIALAITTFSQFYITSKYNKYSKVSNSRKISGFETARKILDKYELNNVYTTAIFFISSASLYYQPVFVMWGDFIKYLMIKNNFIL